MQSLGAAQSNQYDFYTALPWPIAAVLCAFLLRRGLIAFLQKREVEIQLPGTASIRLSTQKVGQTLSKLFAEFLARYDDLLNAYQKETFRVLVDAGKPVVVSKAIEGFDRENDEHIGCVRALRGLGLIEPVGGGGWRPESKVVVTEFGQAWAEFLRRQL